MRRTALESFAGAARFRNLWACTRAEENTARPFGCDPNRLPRRSLPESQTTGRSRESKDGAKVWLPSLRRFRSLPAFIPVAPGSGLLTPLL